MADLERKPAAARRRLLAGGAIAAALVLAAVLWRYPGVDPARGQAAAAAGAAPAAAVAGPSAGTSEEGLSARPHPPAPSAPLPALDTPLRLVVADLKRRADAGDAAAACRLAAEFERCRSLAVQANDFEPLDLALEELLLAASGEEQVAGIRQHVEQRDQFKVAAAAAFEHCVGVPEPDASERARYWRRAALGGHAAAMRHYASGNAFRFDDLMGAVPELEVYRREAEQVALRAAGAGDVAMIHALAAAYLPRDGADGWTSTASRSFLAQVVQPDAGKALAWLYVLQQHPGFESLPEGDPARVLAVREAPRLAAQLPAAQVAVARAAAEGHLRDWPQGAAATGRLAVRGNGGVGDVVREECEPGAPEWQPAATAP